MRVVLTTYDSRGGVEPMLALARQLRALGAEAVLCAPPDCADRAAEVDVPLVPLGKSVRELVHAAEPPSPADVPRVAHELMGELFEKLRAAARGCDAIVASGVMSAVAAARSVAEMLGVPSSLLAFCPIYLPSPHHRPQPLPLRPIPPEVTDSAELDAVDRRNYSSLFGPPLDAHRAAAGLPPVGDVRDHVFGGRIWLAADPVLAPWQPHPALDVVQTGAWLLHDERPLPADLDAFLDAGDPPVYVGFGSMRAPADLADVAIEAIRADGRRVILGRGWADLALVDGGADCFAVGEVNQQELFRRVAAVVHHGGAGTTNTAARAGAPQIVVPQMGDQPYWARRVSELGIGTAHDGPTPTVESLSAALGAALAPEIRRQAAGVAGTTRPDGAEIAAKLLIDRTTSR
ncbi:MAG TPA: glycosyltransferase [Mycobacteriales bacterium]|nr:glycosyltransferase [Mycobacteriales bacterium]